MDVSFPRGRSTRLFCFSALTVFFVIDLLWDHQSHAISRDKSLFASPTAGRLCTKLTGTSGDSSSFSKIANLPGVRRVDDSANILEKLKRKAHEISNALQPRVIIPTVGGIEEEPVVPQFVLDIIAKIPRKSSEWIMIGSAVAGILIAGYALKLTYRYLKYRWQAANIQQAIMLLDMAHSQDPFPHVVTGRPRELVFTERSSRWLDLLYPQASPELRLAVRAHKLESWKMRREQRRVGEFLKQAGLSYLIAPVNFILERRGDLRDPNYAAFQDCVALTNIDGLLESHLAGVGLERDAFLALLEKEWKELSPSAQLLGWNLLVEPLPTELKGDIAASHPARGSGRVTPTRLSVIPNDE